MRDEVGDIKWSIDVDERKERAREVDAAGR